MKKKIETKSELERVSNKLEKLFDLYPVELTDAKEVTVAMRESLARMFGDGHFRLFLENSVKFANQNLIRASAPEQMLFYKARIETLMQMLAMGKQHFIHYEMLRSKVAKQQQVKEEVSK